MFYCKTLLTMTSTVDNKLCVYGRRCVGSVEREKGGKEERRKGGREEESQGSCAVQEQACKLF